MSKGSPIGVMLRVALSLTGSRADAEDLVRESLIRAYRLLWPQPALRLDWLRCVSDRVGECELSPWLSWPRSD